VIVTASVINGVSSILPNNARKRVCHVITGEREKKGFKFIFMIGDLRFSKRKQIFVVNER
jgi:hypothetical protein